LTSLAKRKTTGGGGEVPVSLSAGEEGKGRECSPAPLSLSLYFSKEEEQE
jgi:hypothetical protein